MKDFDPISLEPIGLALKLRGETIAVAESVTAGLLQLAMSSIVEASLFFQGGITAYNLGQKFKHLAVEPIHATANNCVSGRVADEMAINVCTLFNSDWGIGVTGYASPVPESDNRVFAYFSIAYRGEVRVTARVTPAKGSPLEIQREIVQAILDKLLSLFRK